MESVDRRARDATEWSFMGLGYNAKNPGFCRNHKSSKRLIYGVNRTFLLFFFFRGCVIFMKLSVSAWFIFCLCLDYANIKK
jgi:hypothetical protein